ncbi:Eco57I restriction-modification methylase domain-containing protein [Thermobifida cellulosilytica]|uniref:site-specific DNA-methyltransferase (adenine-specific) n=1 Tax=Thermobifida cellulosilytica TB100 TaxID=665004 RepID=A0A147KE81_THECS|nr:DNA methyltransferase [Thermobifida cellulosilytica]KUP95578.1 restriction endonuclease [Thermobifida cellulosilytica TB100]
MSAIARNQVFTAVHTVGGLLPADMLARISEGRDVPGCAPADYGVVGSRSVRDEAERHWDYLKSLWKDLRTHLPVAPPAEPPSDPTGRAVREWVEPLFAELGFGRLAAVAAPGIPADDGTKTFPVSHHWRHVPVHVTAWHTDLDRRPAGAGAVPPQSLVQECLNRTSAHLWAVLTNGRQLRLLRDSSALATAAYVEFDLEAIFDGELFSEFVLLYRLLHATRFETADDEAPSACWLEKWRTHAIDSGTRALEQLRRGVQQAVTVLGTGFLRHPANTALRENLDAREFHTALLRLVYRMLFLFVAEDRDALHPPVPDDAPAEVRQAHEKARKRYEKYFSSARLRRHARRRRGTAHGDRYRALRLVLDALGDENGLPELALPALGGLFDRTDADTVLDGLELSNEALLGAVRHLAQVRDPKSRRWRTVDYRNLDAEELGSIYESLLELVPKYSASERVFELVELAGNTRKTTGSYYTPSSLIECLLDSALDPVVDEAVKRGEAKATAAGEPDPADRIAAELLDLKVCDPACGSGHFLVAAARRIAKKVAAVRERNSEPTLPAVRRALHEVVTRCIYGVDLNPMAVELAKVSLWLEALEPGRPLGFLDAHVKHGNALIGATPALLRKGIPDEAFKAITGDDPKYARFLAKTNREERSGQGSLFDIDFDTVSVDNTALARDLRRIVHAEADTLSQVRAQEAAYHGWQQSKDYVRNRLLADAWCAAFVWHKTQEAPRPVTHELFLRLAQAGEDGAPEATLEEIGRLREQYRFFHWHLEFPDVFTVPDDGRGVDDTTGWKGGFDCVLGNPPWERIKLQEQEFFAQRDTEIATAKNAAARKKLIEELKKDPDRAELYREFEEAKRKAEGESHFLRLSARYPLTGRGDVNTYALFAETASRNISGRGFFGLVLPTGIATDATTAPFFSDLVSTGRLSSFLDFENEAFLLSRDVDHRVRFCLLTAAGPGRRADRAEFAFSTRYMEDLPKRRFAMPPEEILLVNPNTGTLPVFRSRRDAEITTGIYKRVPVLVRENDPDGNPWGISFMAMFHMANDSHLFRTAEQLEAEGWELRGNVYERDGKRMLPLYEAKMLHHFDHRLGTYEGQTEAQANMGTLPRLTPEQHDDPNFLVMPRYWVPEFDVPTGKKDGKGKPTYYPGVRSRLDEKRWQREWLLGWRDIARSSDERTVISSFIPRAAVGHTNPIVFPSGVRTAVFLYSCFVSFVFDYITRQKMAGTHLTYGYLYQLPVPFLPLDGESVQETGKRIEEWIVPRVLELTYTAHDMTPFARDLGDDGPPFRWDEERRAIIRAELDALFFHLYGIKRDDVDYIMETFPIVKRKDEEKYGTYRTKDLILEVYDRMADAGVSLDTPLIDGENFTSTLAPPPGHGPRHDPA